MARETPGDPDAELDATAIAQNLLLGTPPAAPVSAAWVPPKAGRQHGRREKSRQYSANSIPGLADYFTNVCPRLSWSGGLEIGNRQALIAVISELRRDVNLTPDECRALMDLYVRTLDGRSPSKAYVWDFKWRRYQLIREMRDSGQCVTGMDYESWREPEKHNGNTDDDFTTSWGINR
ncbi:hypothetical protein ACFQ61_08380 [Streptomyces sp. NPDC056500]|uniref:hypothetical protein n=1 Tax=Streptomyces sp. NPDC056500 TaxID=3345840 RepID=UPI0036ACA315